MTPHNTGSAARSMDSMYRPLLHMAAALPSRSITKSVSAAPTAAATLTTTTLRARARGARGENSPVPWRNTPPGPRSLLSPTAWTGQRWPRSRSRARRGTRCGRGASRQRGPPQTRPRRAPSPPRRPPQMIATVAAAPPRARPAGPLHHQERYQQHQHQHQLKQVQARLRLGVRDRVPEGQVVMAMTRLPQPEVS